MLEIFRFPISPHVNVSLNCDSTTRARFFLFFSQIHWLIMYLSKKNHRSTTFRWGCTREFRIIRKFFPYVLFLWRDRFFRRPYLLLTLRYQTEISFMNCPQGILFHEIGFIGISQPLVLLIAREYCEIPPWREKYMYKVPASFTFAFVR